MKKSEINENSKIITGILPFSSYAGEIIKISSPSKGGVFVDCTFGGGGYSKALLKYSKTKV